MSTVWQTGFRPFFIVAAVAAGVLPVLWALAFVYGVPLGTTLPGIVWHAHEMLFAFTSAVIAGFLLTAVRNWTGQPTLTGGPLAALVLVWTLGRIVQWVPVAPWVGALVDAAFFVGLAYGIGRPLVATRNRRNIGFVALVLLLGVLDASVHLLPAHALQLLRGVLDVIVVIMVVITGRIVPLFTANALPKARLVRRPTVDTLAIVGAVALLVGELAGLPSWWVGGAAAVTGAMVLTRAAGWAPRAAAGVPLLAILHIGHAWLGIGLLLRAADNAGLGIPPSAATHALTVGAIGSLTLGMMARVTLGHTGRPLRATLRTVGAFGVLTAAAVLRVLVGFHSAPWLLVVAASAFGLAFVLWGTDSARSLLSARVDGRAG